MTILAIDYGDKRVGIAYGNSIARIANPSEVFENNDDIYLKLLDLAKELNVRRVVVGLPRNMDGSLGYQALATQEFAGQLGAKLDVPIILQEETLSSLEAKQAFPAAPIDAAAAAIILQRYFDEHNSEELNDLPGK